MPVRQTTNFYSTKKKVKIITTVLHVITKFKFSKQKLNKTNKLDV